MDSGKNEYLYVSDYAFLWTSYTYSGWRAYVYGKQNDGYYTYDYNGLYKQPALCVKER